MEGFSASEYAHNTIRAYKSSYNNLQRYLKGSDISLSKLDYKFIEGYYTHLRNIEGQVPNSAYKNIKHLYKVIHVCIRNGWLIDNPFKDFPCQYKEPLRPYLTEAEIEALSTCLLPTDRLKRVRDLFLFQIYTGLSYADMAGLTTDNIEIGVDNKQWVVINRAKTGERSAIPLLPVALRILKQYKYQLPMVSNQKLNDSLKELAYYCRIKKILTTHVGRHTFATTVCLSHGVPIETVSKLLGHTDIKTTQIYAKVTDLKTAQDMCKLLS